MGCIPYPWKSLHLSTKTFLQAPQLPGATLLHGSVSHGTLGSGKAERGAQSCVLLSMKPKGQGNLMFESSSCLVSMCLVSHGLWDTGSALPGRVQVSWLLVSCWRWAFVLLVVGLGDRDRTKPSPSQQQRQNLVKLLNAGRHEVTSAWGKPSWFPVPWLAAGLGPGAGPGLPCLAGGKSSEMEMLLTSTPVPVITKHWPLLSCINLSPAHLPPWQQKKSSG